MMNNSDCCGKERRMSYLMGIDLGTSSVKTLIIDLQGNVIGSGQENYDIDIPADGYAEQSPERWWEKTVKTIRTALKIASIHSKDLKGIGLSGQMHGMVLVDKDKKVVRPSIIWADQRSAAQTDDILKKIGKDKFGEITLNNIFTGFQTPSLLWIKNNEPLNYERTWKVLSPKDYIKLQLTGEVSTDKTDASATLAFETAEGEWSSDLLNQIGLDIEKYPDHHNSDVVGGTITRNTADICGLSYGTPVVSGGGDQFMQAVGNGIVTPGIASLTIGTGGQVFTPSTEPLYDKQLRTHTFAHSIQGMWGIMGASLASGLSLKWLKNNILGLSTYQEMNAFAEKVEAGSEGVVYLPYLTGERTPHMDSYAKGMFFGLKYRHSREHLIRAVMEGVAFSLRDSVEIFKSLGIHPKKFVAAGGGATSEIWLKIQASILQTEIYTSKTVEQAAFGAAIVAGVGSGMFSTIQQACEQLITYNDTPIYPEKDTVEKYENTYQLYKDIYIQNKELYRRQI